VRTTRLEGVLGHPESVRRRLHRADVLAFLILAVLVGVLGSGLGVAAAHIRSSGTERGPLRLILQKGSQPGPNDVPSLQRDRIRLRPR
jgi:hypothetical protein